MASSGQLSSVMKQHWKKLAGKEWVGGNGKEGQEKDEDRGERENEEGIGRPGKG